MPNNGFVINGNCLKIGSQPKHIVRDNHRILRGESNIGKLDLMWRTAIGDRGRLQTSQLQRMVKFLLFRHQNFYLSSGVKFKIYLLLAFILGL